MPRVLPADLNRRGSSGMTLNSFQTNTTVHRETLNPVSNFWLERENSRDFSAFLKPWKVEFPENFLEFLRPRRRLPIPVNFFSILLCLKEEMLVIFLKVL